MNYFFQVFSKTLGFLLAIIFSIFLISLFLFFFGENKKKYFSYLEGNKDSSEIIAILNLNGPIISEPPNFNNYNIFQKLEVIYPSLIKEYLKELEKINAKGLIISINSPGGGVSATQRIYNLIKDFKDKNSIPIFFHTKDILTSGSYWVALSGDKIFADYGSIIGSIGVRGPNWLYYNSPTLLSEGLFGRSVESQNGLKLFSNTAGLYKDIFNPFRKPTKEEMDKLQTMVDDIYSNFVNLVSINRKIEKNIITDDIGAMVFNSKRAKLNYLIDDEKNIDEIIELISKKLKLENAKVLINKYEDKYSLFNLNYINFFKNKISNKDLKIIINEKFCNNYYNEFSSIAQNYITINC
tara:strand:+ start:12 stop:1070 length:1059 start_codon:yes stop_codon:yes gene_type:complete